MVPKKVGCLIKNVYICTEFKGSTANVFAPFACKMLCSRDF